ncbi:hypothetical protein Pmani_034158 [Petrolisthes manimaculis]|uniref:Uncharacterized protein n=1 Tax=Petrolisthes manimaculis TaxID=1843537 RepID=A0AAE1NN30_9EUCA|nr:hypothetical protein Pmani_034158 [Petrolisthes manimaculis]
MLPALLFPIFKLDGSSSFSASIFLQPPVVHVLVYGRLQPLAEYVLEACIDQEMWIIRCRAGGGGAYKSGENTEPVIFSSISNNQLDFDRG